MTAGLKAFVSYSHHDAWALERLKAHTAQLIRDKLISVWSDLEIPAGGTIDQEVANAMAQGDLFIPLISADFLNSFYCYERELAAAMQRHDRGEIRVVPVIVEPCDWKSSPLGRFKALPKDGNPISEFTNRNTALLDVATGLRKICEAAKGSPQSIPKVAQPVAGPTGMPRRLRVKKTFDAIDRSDFVAEGFDVIRSYFQSAIAELNAVDGLKGRFRRMSDTSFTSTVTNALHRRGSAHITVHSARGARLLGDVYWSFAPDAPDNTSNGSFNVEVDDYEMFWTGGDIFQALTETDHLTASKAAESLWEQFIEKAGISYAGEDQD